jgi:cell division ATPase FtsA
MTHAAVINFGSTTITAAIGQQGVNNSFIVNKRVCVHYSGIVGRDFVNVAELPAILSTLVRDIRGTNQYGLKRIYVGVPHQFSSVSTTIVETDFPKPHVVKERDIQELMDKFKHSDAETTPVDKTVVYFRADEGRPVINALKESVRKLTAEVSIIAADNYFINVVRSCLTGSGFKKVEFISSIRAEALYLMPEDVRDKTCIMISCGLASTSIVVASGDGIAYLKNIEQGIAHVISDVSTVMEIDGTTANLLVDEAIISVKMGEKDNYEITTNADKKRKFSAQLVNDIVKSRLEVIADHIARVLKINDTFLRDKPIYMCGGNLDAVGGARDFFSRIIGRHIIHCACPYTKQDKPTELRISSLLNLALKCENN